MKVLLSACLAVLCVAAHAERVFRESFESDPADLRQAGWRIPAEASVVTGSRDGSRCLTLTCPEAKAYSEFFLPVTPGKMYRASVWVKSEDVARAPGSAQNRGAVLFCQFANAQKGWVGGGSFPKGLHGTREWTKLEVRYTAAIPESVAFIQVMIGIEGTGTAWFDDLQVEEITAWDEPALLQPADNSAVDSQRPLLTWTANLPHEAYRIALSQSEDFPAEHTHSLLVWGDETRPHVPLTPGTWHWRARIVSARATLPWTPARRFVVPPQAAPWPPAFRPEWTAVESVRPQLAATLAPAAWVSGITASIGGIPASVTRTGDHIDIVPNTPLPQGIHEVVITAKGPGNHSATFTEAFTNKPPGSRITLRQDGIMVADGTPFFPLGAYRDPSDTLTDFSGLTQAGFNVTHSYAFEEKTRTPEQARAYLQAAQAAGLRVFLGFSRSAIRAGERDQWASWVLELMDEPAILTWYMMDEPICHNIPAAVFDELYATIRRHGPGQPASVLLARIRPVTAVQRAYAAASDILWCDPYPVPERPLSMVVDTALACRDAAGPNRPFWVVLQAHDLRYWRGRDREFRTHGGEITRPTAEESRAMAHMALSTGAHGLIWYWGPNSHYHMVTDAPSVWQGLCNTVRELNELMPWLVAPRRPADTMAMPDPFRAWSRTQDGIRILAVVNNSDSQAALHVPLPETAAKTITDRDAQAPATVVDGALTGDFPPWGVRIYQWKE